MKIVVWIVVLLTTAGWAGFTYRETGIPTTWPRWAEAYGYDVGVPVATVSASAALLTGGDNDDAANGFLLAFGDNVYFVTAAHCIHAVYALGENARTGFKPRVWTQNGSCPVACHQIWVSGRDDLAVVRLDKKDVRRIARPGDIFELAAALPATGATVYHVFYPKPQALVPDIRRAGKIECGETALFVEKGDFRGEYTVRKGLFYVYNFTVAYDGARVVDVGLTEEVRETEEPLAIVSIPRFTDVRRGESGSPFLYDGKVIGLLSRGSSKDALLVGADRITAFLTEVEKEDRNAGWPGALLNPSYFKIEWAGARGDARARVILEKR